MKWAKQTTRYRVQKTVIRVLKKRRENFNSMTKDIETTLKNQSQTKDTLTEMKNNLQGVDSRADDAENQISNLEHKKAKNTHTRTARRKKNPLRNEDSGEPRWRRR